MSVVCLCYGFGLIYVIILLVDMIECYIDVFITCEYAID